jgi:hypothetical protein
MNMKLSMNLKDCDVNNNNDDDIYYYECIICNEQIQTESNESVRINCCMHSEFCDQCILKWVSINNSCPLCRNTIRLIKTSDRNYHLIHEKSNKTNGESTVNNISVVKCKNNLVMSTMNEETLFKYGMVSIQNSDYIELSKQCTLRKAAEYSNITFIKCCWK